MFRATVRPTLPQGIKCQLVACMAAASHSPFPYGQASLDPHIVSSITVANMAGRRVEDRSAVRRVVVHRGADRGRGMPIFQTMDTCSRLLDGMGADAVGRVDEAFG
jgi:hypothetical protein